MVLDLMYTHCTFCFADLGRNEAIEHFPVGRRLAFHAARGRLWVVCRSCARWNLSPLEERWEAIEACERAFHDTRLRVATEHIGLARLREGLELVRIGEPPRTEFAGWRYGDQFGRRRRRYYLHAGVGVVGFGAMISTQFLGGMLGLAAYGLVTLARSRFERAMYPGDTLARVTLDDGERVDLSRDDAPTVLLRAAEGPAKWRLAFSHGRRTFELTGDPALRAAAQVLPYLNHASAPQRQVREAVDYLQRLDHPLDAFWAMAAGMERDSPSKHWAHFRIDRQPPVARLALEIAAHEETERRAMEGELALLEQAWQQAEQIAAIADRLALPASVETMLLKLRGR